MLNTLDMTLFEFIQKFENNSSCSKFLSEQKWAKGYACRKCCFNNYIKGNTPFSRRCKQCKYDESPTAHTVFHHLKFPLLKAFHICFRLSTKKGMSTHEITKEMGICQKTAWLFCTKARAAMKSSGNHPLCGEVHVDECVFGGKELGQKGRSLGKKKPVLFMVEKVSKGKIGRVYAEKIENYQKKTIYPILERKIDRSAKVVTDEYPTYDKLKVKFKNAKQIKSAKGANFPEIHIQIMNIKGGLRGIHHKCSEKHLQAYLDQYCYRTNRRTMKTPIVFNLITKMSNQKSMTFQQIKAKAA